MFDHELLTRVLSTPSAPFREGQIIALFSKLFAKNGVPFFQDRPGNLVVGASSEKAYRALLAKRRSPRDPLRLFIAHMDHPGFHGERWISPTRLEFKWHGGSPTKELGGARVWLAARGIEGYLTESAMMTASELIPSGGAIARGEIELRDATLSARVPDAKEIFGGFGFRKPVWLENGIYYTKAADDLVGAFCIATLAVKAFKRKQRRAPPPFLGLLTRAEEVGFIGTIAHFELGHLKRAKAPLVVVSLETSRTLPGAEIGKGPVVRLGDKSGVFDPGALAVFSELAKAVLPDAHQKRVMDGGTCEASVSIAHGLPTVGISVPLGNYHNQSLEGGPDARGPHGPAPEYVHEKDVAGLLTLCEAILSHKSARWDQPFASSHAKFKTYMKAHRELLRSRP